MVTRKKEISDLHPKKRNAGIQKLKECGIDGERWLAMLDADDEQMQRLEKVWPLILPSYVYDAVHLLGFGPASAEPLPKAAPNEVIIRYGGWSLKDLSTNARVRKRNLIWNHDWYKQYPWSNEGVPPGIYRLRFPIPDSNRKTFAEQKKLLLPDEEPISVILAATAMLIHKIQTGEDLLKSSWTRCKELDAGGDRVDSKWHDGRLSISRSCGGDRHDNVCLSSAQLVQAL